ncbi:MAG: SPFH domain-containing protein [Treponema sp.]|nr:SPFH domain-containing protein [Treponema sp.]
MGFLKAAAGAIGGTLADSWKDYFCCNSLDADVLVKKAEHKVNGRSSNTSGTENIITDGSKLIVADGQCALTVDQGKIFNIITEPGAYEFKSGTAPSLFSGGLGEGLKNTVKDMWERFTFGGEPAKDQRVYYMNLKEIIGNKYGTASPIPFRVVDTRARIDMDIAIKCFGEYSFKITNPVLFYTNVCANIVDEFTRDQIASQLKTELLTALQPTFALLSEKGIRYSALPGHTEEISQYLNQQLSAKWKDLRGIEVVSFGVSSVTADEEDAKKIKQMQEMAAYTDPSMAAARLVGAQANAMETAAGNTAGAMTGFMGMGMATSAGGFNPQNLFAMGQQQQAQQAQYQQQTPPPQASAPKQAAPGGATWKCSCGAENTGKFCLECGKPKPAGDAIGWTCSCGTVNKGKFCAECGKPKPAGAPLYKCDKCGWEPADPKNPPKFCPECGDPFNEGDIVQG